MPVPESGWRSAGALWMAMTVESGSNPIPEKDPSSALRFPPDAEDPGKQYRILIVEDNRADVFLIREALDSARVKSDLQVVYDGKEATRFFDELDTDQSRECPCLVILDINLPKKNGAAVLQH